MSGRISTRERILDAALDLFSDVGFGGTSISEVERRVGLAAGTGSFYRHFRSKEELFRAAVECEVARCMAAVAADRDQSSAPDAHEVREVVLQRMLRAIQRFDRLFRLILSEGDRIPELRDVIGTALAGLGESLTWKEHPTEVLLLSALGGYHFFGLVQAQPFQGASEEEFISALAAFAREWDPPAA
ncbi:TetR/AcrR family transcriptional regulator [Mycolicibacterium pyrenivorans]|uniref:TetR/AcrR family transcriptional regulator n=1 Tax=Mycolicibacterium pyrenivorans TaxID=187102 RepID=UPI0021F31C5F|nr:TetR/AcrR family transcriptional regulator [Mycolicibacterium pyrenivorans]